MLSNLLTALFGVVKQKCPSDPLTETFWTVQKCKDDRECGFPRICCPSGRERFCFAGQIESESLPVARQLAYRKYFDKIYDLLTLMIFNCFSC